MKLQLSTFFLLFMGISWNAYAQPANDEPCNATFLGRLDANNRNLLATGLSNVGATNEVIFGDDGGIVLDVNGTFPSCKGTAPWQNTVWFYFDYEYPFNKIFYYEMRVNAGSLHTTLFLTQSICPLSGNPQLPLAFAAPPGGCNVPPNDSYGFGLGCFDFSTWPNSQSGRIYIVVASDTDAQEGEFELEVFLPEPTFCNGCQDQGESAVDDVFAIDNLIKVDENAGSSNGSITIDGVTGGKQPLSYSIDGTNFSDQTVFENLSAGTYIVTVRDANDCITTQQITIEALLPESPVITPPEIACEGEPQSVSATGQNIRWYSNAALTQQVGTGNTFTFTAGEFTQLFATQTVNGFASPAALVNVAFVSLPEVTINVNGDECSATLRAVLSLNNSTATYQWLKDDVEIEGATANSVNSIGAGSYRVRVTIGSCVVISDAFVITGDIPSKPVISPVPTYCEGDAIAPIVATSTGAIRWYANADLTEEVGTGESFQPNALTATTTFWVQAANNNCLSDTAGITMVVNPVPTASINLLTTLCVGERLEAVTETPNLVSYQWLFNGQPIQGATESVLATEQSGEYSVQIILGGCSTTSEAVQMNELPTANAGPNQTVCLGEAVILLTKRTSQSNQYEWKDAQGNLLSNETELEVVPTDTTFYVLSITDENGCFSTDTLEIQVDTTPIEAGFSVPSTIGYAPLTLTFTDRSIAADTVTWNFGDGNTSMERSPTNTFEEIGEYEVVQQVSANGICFRDSSIVVRVVEPLNIPNGISPNGDGSNDRWIIKNIELFPEHTIKVFNQWGNLVFEATNYQNDWSGDQLPDATYFYVITLGGNIPDARGYLMILR